MIDVSIVSHGHGKMVDRLISRLLGFHDVASVILTLNIPEETAFCGNEKVRLIENVSPKGFGANHNNAFHYSHAPYFCVLNPDVEFSEDPFPELLRLKRATAAEIIAPMILNPEGKLEDSVRYFPTVASLARRLLGHGGGCYPISPGQAPFSPDWVAGMFMLFSAAGFSRLEGFDERYFLYCEDIDICRRAHEASLSVVVCPTISVIHDARRDSHKNLRHLRWHLMSMMYYFWKFR